MNQRIELLYQKIIFNLKESIPFVSYCKPNSETINIITQNDKKIYYITNYNESGFIFSPFNTEEKSVIFNLSNSVLENFNVFEIDSISLKPNNTNSKYSQNNKESHQKLIQKGIDFIRNKNAEKIVLSRIERIHKTDFNTLETFKRLLLNYPTAFVYVWYHPEIGLWLGATPETLLEVTNTTFKTMALAGTQTYKNTIDVHWNEKEKQEQQFVTNYISLKLNELNITHSVSETYTAKAGHLIHLRSDIKGLFTRHQKLTALITALHPTPAICGIPKENAKQFILKNEGYNREFYTGFLGELNVTSDKRKWQKNKRNIENQAYKFTEKQSALYVNLRCMQVQENSISLYIGGGITKDSIPEKEYEETIAKTTTMKSVLGI